MTDEGLKIDWKSLKKSLPAGKVYVPDLPTYPSIDPTMSPPVPAPAPAPAPTPPEAPQPIYCLGENTNVLTDKGLKPIKDLQIGDLVYSDNGVLTEVKEIVVELVKTRSIYNINGIYITSDHLLLTPSGWACVDPTHYSNRIGKILPSDSWHIPLDRIPNSNITKLSKNDLLSLIDGETTVDIFESVSVSSEFKVYAVVTEHGSIVIDNGIIADAYGVKNSNKLSKEIIETNEI